MAQDLKLQIMLKAVDKVTRPLRGVIQTAEKLRGQMAQTGSELKNLEGVQRAIEGHRRLQQKLGTTASKMDQVQKEVAEMGRAIAASDSPTQRQIQQFERAKQQLGKLKTAHRQQRQALQESAGALKKAGIDTRNLSNAEAELSRRINTVNSRMSEQAKKLDTIRRKQQALTKAREKYDKTLQRQANLSFVGMAGYGSGTNILRGAASVIQPGIAFEEQISAVGALSRVSNTSEAFAKLREQAKALGASTSFSASEAAGGMQFLAMAGFEVNEILSAMPGMLDLAKAGNTDLGMTADIASNILSGFKLEATQMGRVSDVLAATFTRSNVNLEMLGETMKYVAPAAHKTGASMEEASAMAGLLGNVGIQASMAGTVMRSMYTRMASPSKAALDALSELKIQTTDAADNMRAMPEILAEIAKKTEKLGNAKQLEIFTAIAGKQAGSGLAELVSQGGAGEITKFVDVLKGATGEARRISSQMGDNAAGDIKAMQSAWEGLNITISDTNTGPLRGLIQQVTQIVRHIDTWVQNNPELAGQLLKIVAIVGAMMVGMGGLALTIAGLLGPFAMMRYGLSLLGIKSMGIIAGVKKLGSGLWWLGKTFLWLGRVFLMNPIGLVITAIAGAAYLIYRYWEPIKGFFSGLWQEVKSAFNGGIAGVAALIVNWSPLGLFYKAFAGVMNWFGIELPGNFSEFGSMLISGMVNGIKDKLAAAKEAITSIGESVVSWFKDKLGIRSPSRVFAEIGGFISQGVGQGILHKAQHAVNAVKQMGGQLPKALPAALAVGIAANSSVAASQGFGVDRPVSAQAPQVYTSAPIQAQAPVIHHHQSSQPVYNITINAAPDMDKQAIARAVTEELENQQRQQASRQNSQLYDGFN